MGSTPQYLQLGFVLISVANLIVILLLLIVFAAAVWVRLPGSPPRILAEPDDARPPNRTSP